MKSSPFALKICATVALVSGLVSVSAAQNREKFVISAKAGGVNSVIGSVRLARSGRPEQLLTAQDDLAAGDRVTTGAESRVEVLLNPGSYLRLTENSEFELVDTSLDKLCVRLIRGSAIVEAMGLENTELHISIMTQPAQFLITRRGVYRINSDANSTELLVRKGRAQINGDPLNLVKSGNQVAFRNGSFLVSKLSKKQQDQFDDWSKERANTLARANDRLSARGLNMYLAGFRSFDWAYSAANPFGLWTFSPFSRCFTFLPFYYGWSSPYGHYYDLYYSFYDYWPGRGCCGGGTVVRYPVRNPPSGGSPGGSSSGGSGGSSGGAIGNRPPSPPAPPAPHVPRDPDSRGRPIGRIKDPIN